MYDTTWHKIYNITDSNVFSFCGEESSVMFGETLNLFLFNVTNGFDIKVSVDANTESKKSQPCNQASKEGKSTKQ